MEVPIESKRWLRIEEAGQLLGRSRGYIYRLVNDGYIPLVKFKLGDHISTCVDKRDIDAFFESQKFNLGELAANAVKKMSG